MRSGARSEPRDRATSERPGAARPLRARRGRPRRAGRRGGRRRVCRGRRRRRSRAAAASGTSPRSRRAAAPAASGRGARSRSAVGGELLQIVGSRSLLVDVHLLGGGRDAERPRAGRRRSSCASRCCAAGPFRLPLRERHGRRAAPPRRRCWNVCCTTASEPVRGARGADRRRTRVLFGARARTRAAAELRDRADALRARRRRRPGGLSPPLRRAIR